MNTYRPTPKKPELCSIVADAWETWCGETPWSIALREFGNLGGTIIWWCGYPRSKSAISLCFTLYLNGAKLPGSSRLKDIRRTICIAKKAKELET